MQVAHNFWSMMLSMLHHDIQSNYGQPPEVIALGDINTEPIPDNDIEVIEKNFPIATHVVKHENKPAKPRTHDDSSSDDDGGSTSVVVPVMDRLRYCQFRDIYQHAIIIESKHYTIPDGANDEVLPSTSGVQN